MILFDLFLKHVQEDPNRIFYSDYRGDYSIGLVEEQSARIYSALKSRGLGREDVVAIWLPRDVRVAITMIGIWRAGAAVLVIGAECKHEQAELFLAETDAKLVIDEQVYAGMMEALPRAGYEEADPHDLAYVVYSSGSTGYFKGSLQEYGKFDWLYRRIKLFGEYEAEYGDLSHERFGMIFGMYGIDGLIMIAFCLLTNAYVDIIPYEVARDPQRYHQELVDRRITSTTFAPSHLKDERMLEGTSLEYAYVSYEVFSGIYSQKLPMYNVYGLTEAGIDLLSFLIDRPYEITPVGKPFADVEVFLADDAGKPAAEGQIGEIAFRSEYFRGYIGRPEETAEVLRDGWLYTGDMARINANGDYVILGRKQDLLRVPEGYIVPCEILAALRRCTNLPWAYVKAFEKDGEYAICYYYRDAFELSVEEVRQRLRGQIPDYMLPTHGMKIEQVEYFTSGKTNRKAFPNPLEDAGC